MVDKTRVCLKFKNVKNGRKTVKKCMMYSNAPTAKKTMAKKTAAKKSMAKKTTAKKTAAKKTAAKKSMAKKTAPKKSSKTMQRFFSLRF